MKNENRHIKRETCLIYYFQYIVTNRNTFFLNVSTFKKKSQMLSNLFVSWEMIPCHYKNFRQLRKSYKIFNYYLLLLYHAFLHSIMYKL